MVSIIWAYGVTTVPQRRPDLLKRTLASLAAAGFGAPRLFVDGAKDVCDWESEFNLEVTARWPTIRTYGNWALGLAELYLRQPEATRYAMFQDDFVTYRNLREYLERCPYPDGKEDRPQGYWNLYTFPSNHALAPSGYTGWYRSNQRGLGAVALVFNREAVHALLTAPHMVYRPMDARRGWQAIDGGIVCAMAKAGYSEFVHAPSLVQHTGLKSSMSNKTHPTAPSFRGEEYDANLIVAVDYPPTPPQPQIVQAAKKAWTSLEAWEAERQQLEKAIQEDEARCNNSSPQRQIHYQRLISHYRENLHQHHLEKPSA